MGAGIKQQMNATNYWSYNEFSIKKLTETLLDLSVNKIVMGQRAVSLLTGEWGMYQFSEALEDYSALYTPTQETSRIYKTGDNGLGYRGQFLEFIGPNGIKVTLVHDSSKDDFERNKLRIAGKPGLAESYVYDILNMGTSDGRPNIQKFSVRDGDIRGFEPGLRDPFSPTASRTRIMSNPVDGWTEHRAFIGGAVIYDPTRTGTYAPIALF